MDLSAKEECSPPHKRTKASRVKNQLKSGQDCLFTKEPPEYLQIECSICLCVLCDPMLIDCSCGACFCGPCIEPTLEAKKPCPLCNSAFSTTMADRRLQRTLNSLEVYCSFKEAGCEWKGEMGAVSEHLNLTPSDDDTCRESGCPFCELECCHCKKKLQRRSLCDHEKNCLKRPYKCPCCDDYKSTFKDVTTEHISACPCQLVPCTSECGETLQRKDLASHLETTCPLQKIECSFHYAGCEEKLPRKDMPAHIKDNLAEHMSLQAMSNQRQLDELKSEVQTLKTLVRAHLRIMPLTVVMDEFSVKKKENIHWNSEPFYTHSCGYKMILYVYANGKDDAVGTCVSAYIFIQCSDFDKQLTWPFRGSIRIELLDQKSDRKHQVHVLRFDNDTSGEYTYPGKKGWGFPRFIPHASLSPRYLKNDSLCFRLSHCEITVINIL